MLSNLTIRRPILASFFWRLTSLNLSNQLFMHSFMTSLVIMTSLPSPSFVWTTTKVYHSGMTALHWYNVSNSRNSVLTDRQFISLLSSSFPLLAFIHFPAVCLQVNHLILWLLHSSVLSIKTTFHHGLSSSIHLLFSFSIIVDIQDNTKVSLGQDVALALNRLIFIQKCEHVYRDVGLN
jgi:hypothetical protein